MKKLICLLILVVLVSGCATFSSQKYPIKESYVPTKPEDIAIFKFFPPVAYKPIGEVEARGAPASKWDSLHRRLKEEAAKIGGDAIVIQEGKEFSGIYTAPGSSTSTGSAYGSGGAVYGSSQTTYYPGPSVPMMKKQIIGVVIKYTENE